MTEYYTIKDLERLSGIKAHTIRIWEKRYELLAPNRTQTNIRFYNDEQLKQLLDIALLQRRGLKISRISQLKPDELNHEIEACYKEKNETHLQYEPQIHQLIKAMLKLDESAFEKIFSSLVLRLGLEVSMKKIIFPFMMRVGVLWTTGEIHPGQEHFVSNLVKQKLHAAIDGIVPTQHRNQTFLLYLIENELHELSLLFAAYLLKKNGYEVIYLGQSVPFRSIEIMINTHKINNLLTVFTTRRAASEIHKHLDEISQILHHQTLYIATNEEYNDSIELPTNIKQIHDFEQFIEKMTK